MKKGDITYNIPLPPLPPFITRELLVNERDDIADVEKLQDKVKRHAIREKRRNKEEFIIDESRFLMMMMW